MKIVAVESAGKYCLQVCFSNGLAGVHDFSDLVQKPGEMRGPLRDPAYFARVFLEFGAPTWPNGYDIAPDWLYREMTAAKELNNVATG